MINESLSRGQIVGLLIAAVAGLALTIAFGASYGTLVLAVLWGVGTVIMLHLYIRVRRVGRTSWTMIAGSAFFVSVTGFEVVRALGKSSDVMAPIIGFICGLLALLVLFLVSRSKQSSV